MNERGYSFGPVRNLDRSSYTNTLLTNGNVHGIYAVMQDLRHQHIVGHQHVVDDKNPASAYITNRRNWRSRASIRSCSFFPIRVGTPASRWRGAPTTE